MFTIIASVLGLLAVTITIHARGLAMILHHSPESLPHRSWPVAWLLMVYAAFAMTRAILPPFAN